MTPDDGGPAFPVQNEIYPNGQIQYGHNGMTLRDWFAGKALAGMLQYDATGLPVERVQKKIAFDCYAIADAMIAARKERL